MFLLSQHCFARCLFLFSYSLVTCTCHPEEQSDEGSEYISKTSEATFSKHPLQMHPA